MEFGKVSLCFSRRHLAPFGFTSVDLLSDSPGVQSGSVSSAKRMMGMSWEMLYFMIPNEGYFEMAFRRFMEAVRLVVFPSVDIPDNDFLMTVCSVPFFIISYFDIFSFYYISTKFP
jgi:hypothetical protein